MSPPIVEKVVAGIPLRVVDPKTYPYGNNHFDEFEPIFPLWLDVCLTSYHGPPLLVDIGASFGLYTLIAARMGAYTMPIEPSDNKTILAQNLELLPPEDHARTLPFDVVVFDGSPLPEAIGKEIFGKHYAKSDFAPAAKTTRLDDFFIRGPGEMRWLVGGQDPARDAKPDAIKIDVEGLELGVLEGARETLKKYHPLLLIEDHDGVNPGCGCLVSDYPASIDSSRRCRALLEELGYRVETLAYGLGRKYIVARES
jgi:FkbM family methyltransferase